MKKNIAIIFIFSVFSLCVFADDSGLDDIIYAGTQQGSNSSNKYQADKYKKNAENMTASNTVSKSAPTNVVKVIQEYNLLEKKLKKIYLDLSKAYENNDNVEIKKLELMSWKIKEQMKIVNEKKAFVYQINEYYKALKEFPKSEEMRDLIKAVASDANKYIDLSKQILVLQEKQQLIKKDLEKKQGDAQIIRQKEVLKNMQNMQNKKYGE